MILVTGATGFIGRALIEYLAEMNRYQIRACSRSHYDTDLASVEHVSIEDVSSETDWKKALESVDTVVHTIARVHVMNDSCNDPLVEFRRVNTEATIKLARQASELGVKRFIYLSSIKVNGEQSGVDNCFRASDAPSPVDPYAVSKKEAEEALLTLASTSEMEVVIIRPPLVYGPGVKGNLASMVNMVEMGFPLPLGSVKNKRSLVGIDNLIDLIVTCMGHPEAANKIFLVSDDHDLSTTELLKLLGSAMGKAPFLFKFPPDILSFGLRALGKFGVAQRLLYNLQVDLSETKEILDWHPPVGVEEGLRRCFIEH